MVFGELWAPLPVAVGTIVGAATPIGAPVGTGIGTAGVEPDDESTTVMVGVGPGVLAAEGVRIVLAAVAGTGADV